MQFRLLPGLPPYGALATPFPAEWGRLGHEGVVVEFLSSDGTAWTGNFAPGYGGPTTVLPHPDGHNVLVLARGDVWVVNPSTRQASLQDVGAIDYWEVMNPSGFVFSLHGLEFWRLSPDGVLWHTRKLSWDGFCDLAIIDNKLVGQAWNAVDDKWVRFEVDLDTGRSIGGAFDDGDAEG